MFVLMSNDSVRQLNITIILIRLSRISLSSLTDIIISMRKRSPGMKPLNQFSHIFHHNMKEKTLSFFYAEYLKYLNGILE